MQDDIKQRNYEEAWDLYAEGHEASRDQALADTRKRLHRLGQEGHEITPEIEERELRHAKQQLHVDSSVVRENDRFIASEGFDVATKSGLDAAAEQSENAKAYRESSERSRRRTNRADEREAHDVQELAKRLRQEDALTNVDNRLERLTEKGVRQWPWERFIERRRALNQLRGEEISEDWLAYARDHRNQEREEFRQNDMSLSETKRTIDASGDRIKGTLRKGGLIRKLFAVPSRLVAEAGRLGWYGAKRGRKEYRVRDNAKKRTTSQK